MSQNRSYQNADIYLESEILNDHALLVKDGLVAGIVPRSESPADFEIINLESNSIAPGFVDLQVNGGGGILFNSHQDYGICERGGSGASAHWCHFNFPDLLHTQD